MSGERHAWQINPRRVQELAILSQRTSDPEQVITAASRRFETERVASRFAILPRPTGASLVYVETARNAIATYLAVEGVRHGQDVREVQREEVVTPAVPEVKEGGKVVSVAVAAVTRTVTVRETVAGSGRTTPTREMFSNSLVSAALYSGTGKIIAVAVDAVNVNADGTPHVEGPSFGYYIVLSGTLNRGDALIVLGKTDAFQEYIASTAVGIIASGLANLRLWDSQPNSKKRLAFNKGHLFAERGGKDLVKEYQAIFNIGGLKPEALKELTVTKAWKVVSSFRFFEVPKKEAFEQLWGTVVKDEEEEDPKLAALKALLAGSK